MKIEDRYFGDAVLIVGAGLAGLFLALRLAPRKCVVLSQSPIGTTASSAWAQGGIAAALGDKDSAELHTKDTIAAGAGLVDETAAKIIATDGPQRIRDLFALGVPFDKTPDGEFELGLEAAHSMARVAKVSGDLAGREIMKSLIARAQAAEHIEILENTWALSLLQAENGAIGGVLAGVKGGYVNIHASHTVLATGGIGGLYDATTNPIEARGQGLGMAARCGALIRDPEFVQFHPTALNIGKDPAPLASEALRGEGAILRNKNGASFMENYHELGNLAPRDIVARAVFAENAAGRGAYLDAVTAIGDHFPKAFPTVFASAMAAGIDPRIEMMPVAPAEHYHMGGILTDLWGRTTLKGLCAIGECASTGVHGANRLASNSLLEAVVFAARLADVLREDIATYQNVEGEVPNMLLDKDLQNLRKSMSANVGVIRNQSGLEKISAEIGELKAQYSSPIPNELITASLIVKAAIARHESRGGHYRDDFNELVEPPMHSHLAIDGDGDIKLL